MRFVFSVLGVAFVAALATTSTMPSRAQAQDAFLQACMSTTPQKMCECISAKLPADKRAAAIDGLRNMAPGGNLLDPSNLSQEQMQGIDAVVIAQASCI